MASSGCHSPKRDSCTDPAGLPVDFGYILGRDPKPFPPPVKVCREMVDAMGGPNSPHYNRFKSLCYTAFIGLRKNANLILNLIALMVDASIQDIRLEPDKAVLKVSIQPV
jgi:phosphatidylinositol 3-kinase